jgi:hypothetical protein
MSEFHVNDQRRRSSSPDRRFADHDLAWTELHAAVLRGQTCASEEMVRLSGAIAEFDDVHLSIVGADVYLPSARDPTARLSSHSAAFEATCRFHDCTWQPTGCSWMTHEDTAQLEILRRCACVFNASKESIMSQEQSPAEAASATDIAPVAQSADHPHCAAIRRAID